MSGRPVPSQLDQVLPRFYVQKAGPYHPFGKIRIAPFGKEVRPSATGHTGLFASFFVVGLLLALVSVRFVAVSVNRLRESPSVSLSDVEGLGLSMRARLAAMQVDTVQGLATSDPLRLLGRASANLLQIIDWIAQAQLLMLAPERERVELHRYGVRTIFGLERLLENEKLLEGPSIAGAAPTGMHSVLHSAVVQGIIVQARESTEYARLERLSEVAKTPEFDSVLAPAAEVSIETEPRRKERLRTETPSVDAVGAGIIARFPDITLEGHIRSGERFYFVIDLPRELPTKARSSEDTAERMPPAVDEDWEELFVVVELDCFPVVLDEKQGVILLRRGKPSIPCRLAARLPEQAELDTQLVVLAMFSIDGQVMATWSKTFDFAKPCGAMVTPSAVAARDPWPIQRRGKRADAEWVIGVPDINKPAAQQWRLTSDLLGDYLKETEGPAEVSEANTFSKSLQERLSNAGPDQVHDRLKGYGKSLWDCAPRFKDAYWAMWDRKPHFTLQIVSRDNIVPWEYAVPVDVDRNDKPELLILRHPIARRTMSINNVNYRVAVIEDGKVAIVAPTYANRSDGIKSLPKRDSVLRTMTKRFKAIEIPGRRVDVLSLLKGDRISSCAVIYYYGHGAADVTNPLASRLLMEQGPDDLAVDEAKGAGIGIGKGNHTLALLTACEVGAFTCRTRRTS